MESNVNFNKVNKAVCALTASALILSLSSCKVETNDASPEVSPSATESLSPNDLPAPIPSPAPNSSLRPPISVLPHVENPTITLQKNLNSQLVPLGMPALELDGKTGGQTKRALCAIRLLGGSTEANTSPTNTKLSYPFAGWVVSRSCQILVVNTDKKVTMVVPVSTGRSGHTTPDTDGTIKYGRYGWHNSSLYPNETGNGNMYDPMYFNGAIAVHGSSEMYPSVTTPRSHGCVRVTVSVANKLWKLAGGPTTGKQNQFVSNLKPLPIQVL